MSFADSLILGGFSQHSYGDFNEVHPAIGYERKGVEVAAYYNSYEELSYSFAITHKLNKDYGLRLGLATGYEDKAKTVGGLIPMFQLAYYKPNYTLGFGFVNTVTFKVNL